MKSSGLNATKQIHPSVLSTLPDWGASSAEGRGREIPGADKSWHTTFAIVPIFGQSQGQHITQVASL